MMLIAALVKMLPAPRVPSKVEVTGHYDQLIHNIFTLGKRGSGKAVVVAFASVSKGAGASLVAQEIGLELASYGNGRTAIVDARRLSSISKSDLEKWAKSPAAGEDGIFWLKNEDPPAAPSKQASRKRTPLWQGDAGHRKSCIQLLRKHFQHVLIDCHSASAATTLTLTAEFVDGVVLVAAAGQTRRHEIQRAEQIVEMAQGKILGFILNKRKYPIPKWLYEKI